MLKSTSSGVRYGGMQMQYAKMKEAHLSKSAFHLAVDSDCPLANLRIGKPPIEVGSAELEYEVGSPRTLAHYK